MIPILFPVSNLDMNENANIEDSDLISAIGSATPPDIGQYSGQMNFTTGLLTEELPYLLDGIFNNSTSSTAVVPQDADGGTAINPPVAAAVGLTQVDTNHPSKLKIAFAAAPGAAGTFTITGYTKIGLSRTTVGIAPRRSPSTPPIRTTNHGITMCGMRITR